MFGPIWWILAVAALLYVIIDIATKQKSMQTSTKVIWIVCAVLFSVITAIVYYFVVKKK